MFNTSTTEFLSLLGAFWNSLGLGPVVIGFFILMGVVLVVRRFFDN